ncbi:MAG: zinc-ribbon domain-containing protein [Paraprevotella sp.]|nr:zinc-ribbon domain-containing protein [Paraprevotella sp.]
MNIAPFLAKAFVELNKAMKDSLNDTQLESIKETISNYAIAAAVASAVAGVIPGIAGVVAALTQAGFVWATYVKINKTLGISMSENTAKFIGSAIVTNLVTNCGALLLAYAAACVVAFIPGVGMAANAILGYIIVYVSAIIYLKLITRLMNQDGTLHVDESDDTKHIIHDIIKDSNIKDMVKEGKEAYSRAKKNGDIDKAKNNPTCPNCGASTRPGQKFCSECGERVG